MRLTNKIVMISLISMGLTGCFAKRHEVYKPQLNELKTMTTGSVENMQKLRNSEKRGFADFDCDGVEDMVQINDEKLFGQDYKMDFFKGYYDNDELRFKTPQKINLDIKSFWGENVKLDSGDLNGDSCADIVFTTLEMNRSKIAFKMSVAMNQGNLNFTSENIKLNAPKNNDFSKYLSYLIRDISFNEDESIYDYIKMDWADFDGNGTDDFAIFLDDDSDLSFAVYYTEKTSDIKPKIVGFDDYWIQKVMYGARIKDLDTGDLNGDSLSDIVIAFDKNGQYINYAVVMNKNGKFIPHKDLKLYSPIKEDFIVKATKRDLFDNNGDGKDDFVWITEKDDKPLKVVWFN